MHYLKRSLERMVNSGSIEVTKLHGPKKYHFHNFLFDKTYDYNFQTGENLILIDLTRELFKDLGGEKLDHPHFEYPNFTEITNEIIERLLELQNYGNNKVIILPLFPRFFKSGCCSTHTKFWPSNFKKHLIANILWVEEKIQYIFKDNDNINMITHIKMHSDSNIDDIILYYDVSARDNFHYRRYHYINIAKYIFRQLRDC